MNTFENFTKDFIRQQEVANVIVQLENRMDILRKHQTSLVRNWFCEAHPDLAHKMIEHPNGKPNFYYYTVGASNENPMGTHISIHFLVGIDNDPACPADEYDVEDFEVWQEKCYPLTDLQSI